MKIFLSRQGEFSQRTRWWPCVGHCFRRPRGSVLDLSDPRNFRSFECSSLTPFGLIEYPTPGSHTRAIGMDGYDTSMFRFDA
jgi:hypothetical protein